MHIFLSKVEACSIDEMRPHAHFQRMHVIVVAAAAAAAAETTMRHILLLMPLLLKTKALQRLLLLVRKLSKVLWLSIA